MTGRGKIAAMPNPQRVVIVGAGRVGRAVAALLAADPRFEPILADIDREALRQTSSSIETVEIGHSMAEFLRQRLQGAAAAICTVPSGCAAVAQAARAAGCHYFDLADDTGDTSLVAKIAEGAESVFITSCGFSPGYVTALLRQVLTQAGPGSDISVQVGVLPAEREGRLGYGDLWGVDGLVKEYTRPCLALRGGRAVAIPPLSEAETLSISGADFEAFTTAGALDDVVREVEGHVNSLTYKTIRYPGHLDYIRFLLEDMGLGARLYALKNLLMNALKRIDRDRAIVRIVHQPGTGAKETEILREFHAISNGVGGWTTAVAGVSAAHVCAILDVVCFGPGLAAGHYYGGDVPLDMVADSPLFAIS